MTWTLFWGILLILLGSGLIIKIVFNIDLPLAKIFIAFVLIYIGIRIMVGQRLDVLHPSRNDNAILFGEGRFTKLEDGHEYSVVFGKGVIDLSDLGDSIDHPCRIKINTVFGSTVLNNFRHLPVKVNANAAFAHIGFPNGNKTVFGTTQYSTDSLDFQKPYIEIEVNTVFGEFRMP